MNSVLAGFGALVAVIVVGWVAGRARVLGDGAAGVLSRLSYFVATPALLLLTLAEADPGALASSYVNAGNLGVPIAVYVLGDASYVAPVLLFQVLVLAPVGLTVLAGSRAESRSRLLTQSLRTPVVVGCALGLAVAAIGWALPPFVRQPIDLLAALAVPATLLAYGMSLHGAPRPASGDGARQVWLAVALTTLVQPALAFTIGRWVADLDGVALLAVASPPPRN